MQPLPPAPAGKRRGVPITRRRLAAAAFAIVDAEGADALSARKLARALGCEAMSLYHHVPTMDAVLDDVVGELLEQCVPRPLDAGPVRRQLQRAADDYLALALRHPRVFALAAGRRWVSPSAYALAGSLVAMFEAGGLTPRRAGRAARAVGAYLNGAGLALAGWKLREPSSEAPASNPDPSPAARKLRRQFDPLTLRRDLDSGLRVLVDGLLASNTARPGAGVRPASV